MPIQIQIQKVKEKNEKEIEGKEKLTALHNEK